MLAKAGKRRGGKMEILVLVVAIDGLAIVIALALIAIELHRLAIRR